jgi:hypothetical protein
MIKQNYVIYSQKSSVSRHGGRITTINAIGVQDRKDYITYIDPTNFNSQNWQDIITKPNNAFIVHGLTVKNIQGKYIINADSKPRIIAETSDPSTLLYELHELWREQDEPKTKFKDLFDV